MPTLHYTRWNASAIRKGFTARDGRKPIGYVVQNVDYDHIPDWYAVVDICHPQAGRYAYRDTATAALAWLTQVLEYDAYEIADAA